LERGVQLCGECDDCLGSEDEWDDATYVDTGRPVPRV
jgi:hypothetical protein